MMSKTIRPKSCDTFIVLPPLTDANFHIFGKNSDRPSNEVQEVIFVTKEKNNDNKNVVRCTHIEIPQVSTTYRCILSKPAWCWGAEIGANEHGVCIGNEAVHSRVSYQQRQKSLTGLDIVRLALERANSAKSAVEIIGELIETYGQGGVCYDGSSTLSSGYDNSFLLMDSEQAWTIETCDRVWVAKQIKEGFYNISNLYSIEDEYELQSKNLETFAQEKRLWDGKGKLSFAKTFQDQSSCAHERHNAGHKLLEEFTKNATFSVFDMISILRDDQSGICMSAEGGFFHTTGSQVSVLNPTSKKTQLNACHFFTGTPNPKTSLFKPFIFSDNVELGSLTVSTRSEATPNAVYPLYVAHQKATREQLEDQRLREFEHEGIVEILNKLKSTENAGDDTYENLFYDAVSAEIELIREYRPRKHT